MRTRCVLLLALGLLGSVVALPLAEAAGDKTLRPADRIRSVASSEARQGPKSGIPPLGVPGGPQKPGSPGALPAALTATGNGPPPTVLLNKPGLNRADGGLTPPDSTGAIGPNHYVEIVNSAIGVYDRQNLQLISKASLTAGGFTTHNAFFDPQIQWDQQAQRWFYLGIGPFMPDFNRSLVFGWSKTTDPSDVNNSDGTSGWCQYLMPSSTSPNQYLLDDYPKLGHNDTHLIFGSNMFTGTFLLDDLGARVLTVPKPPLGQTTCPAPPTVTSFGDPASPLLTADGHWASTPVPANTIDQTANGYVVAADNPAIVNQGGSANQIMAWHVNSAGTLIQDGNMNVTSFQGPDNVPQPGTSTTLDTMPDGRLTQAVADADPDAGGAKAVWTQHTVAGTGGRADVRWYELLPATTTVRQEGVISSATDYLFNAAISPTKKGNEAAIFYNVSSSTQLPQIRGRGRKSGAPLGEMGQEITLGTSVAPLECSEGNCRWGDYSGASPDHRNAHAVWGTNQLAGPAGTEDNWTTRNFAVSMLKSRLATLENGQIVHPVSGFDTAVGQLSITSSSPTPYDGTKQLRAIYFPSTGNAQGRITESLPNDSDIWYGAAFHLDNGFKAANGNVALMQWEDPVTNVHGGVVLRTDDQYHVVRGNTNSPNGDVNVGPAFDLPEGGYFWLEVHQRLDPSNSLTEVFLNGRLISTSAATNSFPDSFGIPSRISYGAGSQAGNAFQVHVDRASLHPLQRGAFVAPATPTGFSGSGQDQTAILFWNAVPGATGYRVYKQNADGTWSLRFDLATTAVFEPGLTNCTTYHYRVSAYNAQNVESVVSEPLTITPKAANQTC